MIEKLRVLMPSEVPALADKDVEMDAIGIELNNYINSIKPRINMDDLGDWRLLVSVNSRATSGIGIYKRATRYPSDKEFEISISIAIPDDGQIFYGVDKSRQGFFTPLNDKDFYVIEPKFENHTNLFEYILENAKIAIDLGFSKGFTCNGKRIKFQD